MNDAIKLIGIVIVVIGFVMKFDTLATVVVAGLVTGLISGMSIMDILNTLGTAFLTNRTATLFILTLPVVGLCERMGLRDKAVDLIKGIKNATTGRLLVIWEGVLIKNWWSSTVHPSINQSNGSGCCDCEIW